MIVGTRLLQQGVTALLRQRGDITVVGACSPSEAVAFAREHAPDIAVVQLHTATETALACLPDLHNLQRAPRTIAIARHDRPADVAAAVSLGVEAWVAEEGGTDELLKALDAVRRRVRYVGPLFSELLKPHPPAAPARPVERLDVSLTPREREVLALIAQGESDPEIARRLGRSPRTIHTHRTKLMQKLGVHNAIGLFRRAVQLGLVEL